MDENATKSPEKEVPISGGEDVADVKEVSEQQTEDSPTETAEDISRHSNSNSGYETVDESEGEVDEGEENDVREGEEDEEEEEKSARRRSAHSVSGSETEASVILEREREEGDGQESVPAKKVDDDEDKKNPQYIPKRGTFYEHDDRTADDVAETETTEPEKDSKKKVWQDKKEKWSHDRYNDSEQAPKSRAELIAIYGYDIRNEDGPPRARRRRRYGRGPNKYTRNWEDEDAYGRPPVAKPKKPPVRRSNRREGEEFPPLNPEQQGSRKPPPAQEREKDVVERRVVREKPRALEEKSSTSAQQQEKIHQPAPPPKQEIKFQPQNGKSNQQQQQQPPPRSIHVGSSRVTKPPKKEIQDSDYRGFTRSKNFKTSAPPPPPPAATTTTIKLPPKKAYTRDSDFIQSQNFTNKNQQHKVHELEGDMGKLSVQDGVGLKNGGGGGSGKQGGQQQRQGSVPPRLQGEQKSSKRYSSLRQRSLPETAAPPFGQHPQSYYPNEFNQAQQPTPSQQQQQQPPPIIHPATTQVPQIPPPPIPTIPQQVPTVSATPILQAPPPQFGAPFPQAPPAFLQPGVPAPAFMPQQTPQLINYVQSQPQFTQAPYQGYQQAFNTVNQPTELYQPQGGITYYSAQEQQVAQRAAPLRRPKAAIPIVPPPPSEPRGRGRGIQQPETSTNTGGNETAAAAAAAVAAAASEQQTYEISKEFEDSAIAVEQ